MTSEQFTFWLQGFMEINDPETLGVRETQIIKDHLKLVFDKQTPARKQLLTDAPRPYTAPYISSPGTVNPYTVTCGADSTNRILC
jgi:hypothetical protein